MKIPSPLNGWRVFAGEVGVIVLGVLLALGSQQVAEDMQMRSAVREFRKTIDHEIGMSMFAYEVRSRGSACNEKRIAELTEWVKKARDGQELPKILPIPPTVISPYRSAWDTRDGEVFSHVPAKARQKYAEFYDELDNNFDKLERELEEWMALQRFALPGAVSLEERRMMYGHLRMAYVFNAVWPSNMEISRKIADDLGIKPIRPDTVAADILTKSEQCQPAFEPVAD